MGLVVLIQKWLGIRCCHIRFPIKHHSALLCSPLCPCDVGKRPRKREALLVERYLGQRGGKRRRGTEEYDLQQHKIIQDSTICIYESFCCSLIYFIPGPLVGTETTDVLWFQLESPRAKQLLACISSYFPAWRRSSQWFAGLACSVAFTGSQTTSQPGVPMALQ